MSTYKKIIYLLGLSAITSLGSARIVYAQSDWEPDSVYLATLEMDSILIEELASDSLSIIDILDSLLAIDYRYSSLMIRTGYISDIVNAGRDFGVSQYGFSAGVSYYHKSGLFGDISGYWNSDIDPHYNPTTLSLGFMKTVGKVWSFISSYDHYIYENTGEINYALTNSVNFSSYFDIKFFSLGIDYSFLFGDESAHRIRPNIFFPISFNEVGFIDQINLYPSASILLGNQNIYYINENYQVIQSEIKEFGYTGFKRRRKQNSEQLYQLVYEEGIDNVFGILNYSLSIPIIFKINNFTLSLGYYFNIPVPLPGEDIEYTPNSYFNVNLLYAISFKKK